MTNILDILNSCHSILPEFRGRRSMKQVFAELAEQVDEDEYLDNYGSGPGLSAFEAEMATLFGKESGVFMPTGTMAQQIGLRIWCDQRKNHKIAMHPTAHLEFAEHLGYHFLHGMDRLQFGAPEFLRNRMLTVKDFERLGQEPGAILLELPYRPLGGPLPSWDDLLAIRAWATERGIPMHLDGARIWQCRPFYGKEYHEIAALFESVYISFYKDIGGLCGAMLLGPTSFIAEARVWQIRHGGRLRTQGPFWASAKLGVKYVVPQIDQWVEKSREVAAVLSAHDKVHVFPDPPHTNLFHLYVQGDPERLNARHMELAEETGMFLFYGLEQASLPGFGMTEISCGASVLDFDIAQLPSFLDRLLDAS